MQEEDFEQGFDTSKVEIHGVPRLNNPDSKDTRSDDVRIDIASLIKLWAKISALEADTTLGWIYCAGILENSTAQYTKFESSKTNQSSKLVSKANPPRVTLSTNRDKIEKHEILGRMELSDPIKDIGREFNPGATGAKIIFQHEYTETLEVYTEQTFQEGFEFSASLEYFGAGIGAKYTMTELFTKGQSTAKSEKNSLNFELSALEDKRLTYIIREVSKEYSFRALFQLEGNVAIATKKNIIQKFKVSVLPITAIFDDLNRYSELPKYSSEFTPKIVSLLRHFRFGQKSRCYEIMLTGTFRVKSCSCNPELGSNDIDKMLALRSNLSDTYADQFKKKRGIPRPSFFDDEIYDGEYIDLEMHEVQRGPRKKPVNTETLEGLAPNKDQKEYELLVTGDPGVGKTTLGKQIVRLSKDLNSRWSTFEWVFLIPLRNLTEDNYPERKEPKGSKDAKEIPYEIGDIIIRECFERRKLGIRQMDSLKALSKHWSDLFRSIVTGTTEVEWIEILESMKIRNRSLIILDGFDELALPQSLNYVFRELISCPFVIVTSRKFDLYSLEKNFNFVTKQVEVKGFSVDGAKDYAKDYLTHYNSVDPDSFNKLIAFFNGKLHPAVLVPVMLQMLCMAWIHHSDRMQANGKLNLAQLMHDIVVTWCSRYLTKFVNKRNPSEVRRYSPERVLDECKIELCFAEYFAFSTLAAKKAHYEPDSALKYIEAVYAISDKRSPYLVIDRHADFGLVLLSVVDDFSPAPPGFSHCHFNLEIFRDYFAARYLVSCIQSGRKSRATVNVSVTPHEWKSVNGHDIKSYLAENAFREPHSGVTKFMTEIFELFDDQEGLQLLREAGGEKNLLPQKMKNLHEYLLTNAKGYSFRLFRKSSSVLQIDGACDLATISAKAARSNFTRMTDRLKDDLEKNSITSCRVIELDDSDSIQVESKNTEHLNEIAIKLLPPFALLDGTTDKLHKFRPDKGSLSKEPEDLGAETEDILGCRFQ